MIDIIEHQKYSALVVGSAYEFVDCKVDEEVFHIHNVDRRDCVPGDTVEIEFVNNIPVIVAQHKRRNALTRTNSDATRRGKSSGSPAVIAANIDYGIIVASAVTPAFHPRFIDRYLLLLELNNIRPMICITKADLASRYDDAVLLYGSLNIPIVEVSKKTGEGMDELKSILKNNTVVFVGQSGVGKSSLVHALVPDIDIQTQDVSKKTGTGRHTTTASELYEWAPGSMIIDTPGIRTLNIDHISKDELRLLFREFDVLSPDCKFRNCSHSQEPRCAVKDAVESGSIPKARYESYVRLMEE